MIRSVNPAVKPAGAWHPRPRSRARRNPYWTNKRVLEGLRRAARDIWNNDTSVLPSSTQAYTRAIMRREHCPPGKGRLLYPSANRVLETYESMNHAWYALGFLVETKVRRVAHDLITPEIEGRLREIYGRGPGSRGQGEGLPTVKQYARELGIAPHILTQRAAKMGIARPKEPPWTRAELKLLDKYAHLSPVIIGKHFTAAGFQRSALAIRLMRKRRNAHKGSPYYSQQALATLLGIDPHKFDREWLLKFPEELTHEMKGTMRKGQQGGDTKLFHVGIVREFIIHHPEEIDLRKVDKMWFLWLVTGGRVKLIAPSERLGNRAEGYRPDLVREHRKPKNNRPGTLPS